MALQRATDAGRLPAASGVIVGGINSSGVVVGTFLAGPYNYPFIYYGGRLHQLDDLFGLGKDWNLSPRRSTIEAGYSTREAFFSRRHAASGIRRRGRFFRTVSTVSRQAGSPSAGIRIALPERSVPSWS